MQFYGQAANAANRILALFRSGNVPQALAPIFIKRTDAVPCRAWSWSNQLLTALAGFDDARGFRQWESVGRHVVKGAKAFYILAPCTRKIEETNDAGEQTARVAVVGFKGVPVFGYEQTGGAPIADRENSARFVDALPLVNVAREWGLNVGTFDGTRARYMGLYRSGQAIALGVENLSTWAHELMHAADDRLGELRGSSKLSREVVAELGGAILLTCIGRESDADYGGCWQYVESYAAQNGKQTLSVCEALIKRTCEAVALIMKTADELAASDMAAPGSESAASVPAIESLVAA